MLISLLCSKLHCGDPHSLHHPVPSLCASLLTPISETAHIYLICFICTTYFEHDLMTFFLRYTWLRERTKTPALHSALQRHARVVSPDFLIENKFSFTLGLPFQFTDKMREMNWMFELEFRNHSIQLLGTLMFLPNIREKLLVLKFR